jgi:long-chain acyl-CoA synthetase
MSATMTGITQTLARRLQARAAAHPERVALREKRFGLWHDITWAEYWENAELVAHGLLAIGLEPGDRVAVHSENRPEWVFADSGIVAARCVTVGLYPTNPSAEVAYLLSDSGTRILFAEDQEQVDKAIEIAGQVPQLEKIIVFDPRGTTSYTDPRLQTWDSFLEEARAHRAKRGDAVSSRMSSARPEDIACLIYTSGTTGAPKGAMLSVANIEFAIGSATGEGSFIQPPPGQNDVLLSYLPLSHVYERLLTSWLSIAAGNPVYFAESIDTVVADLRQVQPTIFASVPRILEKVHAGVAVRMASASRIKKLNYALWSKAAAWMGRAKVNNRGRHTFATRIIYALGYLFLYRALQDRIGLRHCRVAISGAAPISPQILEWFMGIGVPMVEAYGMTESSAIGTSNRKDEVSLGSVGKPLPGVEMKLDEQTGEILMRHGGVFVGYWNKPDATRETVDEDGWLHTGDVGRWTDDGALKIVDRIKDIIITAGGKNISPSEIENALKTSPFIKEAMVIGDGRRFLSALIAIDLDVVGSWASAKGLTYTTLADLVAKPEVVSLIQKAVDGVNDRFARVEQIKKFRLLPKELDHDQGELTATQKLRRKQVLEGFRDLVDDLYGSDS